MKVNVSIPSATILFDRDAEYVVYSIICRYGGKTWRSDKRFSEFRDFSQNMAHIACTCKKCGVKHAIGLPPRYAMSRSNHSPNCVRERRMRLEKYIGSFQDLCSRHKGELDSFLHGGCHGLLDQDDESITIRGAERSLWEVSLRTPSLANFHDLNIQFEKKCLAKVRHVDAAGNVHLCLSVCTPRSLHVRTASVDVEVYKRLLSGDFSKSSFPTFEHLRKKQDAYRAAASTESDQSSGGRAPKTSKQSLRQRKKEMQDRFPLDVFASEIDESLLNVMRELWALGSKEKVTSPPVSPMSIDGSIEAVLKRALETPSGEFVAKALEQQRWEEEEKPWGREAARKLGRTLVGILTESALVVSADPPSPIASASDDSNRSGKTLSVRSNLSSESDMCSLRISPPEDAPLPPSGPSGLFTPSVCSLSCFCCRRSSVWSEALAETPPTVLKFPEEEGPSEDSAAEATPGTSQRSSLSSAASSELFECFCSHRLVSDRYLRLPKKGKAWEDEPSFADIWKKHKKARERHRARSRGPSVRPEKATNEEENESA